MDKDTDKYKDKDKSALLAHHIGPLFGLVFWSSSEVLESRWSQKTSHLPKSLIAVHKDQMSLASYEEKTKTDLEKYHFCSIENIYAHNVSILITETWLLEFIFLTTNHHQHWLCIYISNLSPEQNITRIANIFLQHSFICKSNILLETLLCRDHNFTYGP